jgi:ubiquinone/menaquinone biosynthesis C-methylase UbiE
MTDLDTSAASPAVPNHHAHHPPFAGVSGLLAALTFSVGRGSDGDLALRLTATGPDDHVVDVGCGPGTAVRRAAGRAASVVGVDPAPVMLRVARILTIRRARAVRYLEGAAEALPLPNASGTVWWSIATVHHWKDVDAGIAEARRVLRPSGRLLAVERLVEPGARGLGSHGWTDDQAEAFAARCAAAGFADVAVSHHDTHRRVVAVLAHRGG